MLTFIARSDIVVYPFAEFFPMEVPYNQFNSFFLRNVSGYLAVVASFRDLSYECFF